MRRVRLVNTQTHFVWIRQQPCIQERFIPGLQVRAEFLFLLCICRAIRGVFELFFQDRCCAHSGTAAIERTPASKTEPCFVPEEYEIGFDRQTFLHYALYVVNLSIEGTVCEDEHFGAVQFSFRFEIKKCTLDCA